jgi:hypothetical protein
MNRTRIQQVVLFLLAASAMFAFFRTPGAETVRGVQILLLFASGMCTGVALVSLFRGLRNP